MKFASGVNRQFEKFVYIAAVLLMTTASSMAAPGKAPVPNDIPTSIFTLQSSTKFKMPIQIQNMIMYCVKMSPDSTTIWRDEFNNIHNNKKIIIQWLDDKIDISISNDMLGRKEQYANALSKGEWERAGYWMNQMGGLKEEDRFAWVDSMKEMGVRWHEYVLHGW